MGQAARGRVSMSGFDRAERRRQARAAAKTRTLFHGTAARFVADIERDGLRRGAEGRCFLTDSRVIARSYAVWETARQAALDDEAGLDGALLTVRVPAALGLTVERDSYPPPLPWETRLLSGISYYVQQSIAPDLIERVQLFEIPELHDPAQLEAANVEYERACNAFNRADAHLSAAAPMMHAGDLRAAIPDHAALHQAIMRDSPNGRSRWHGERHWLGVLVAAIRLLEHGCEADPAVLLAFALLHDSQRLSEGDDPDHGKRAAARAVSLQQRGLLRLTESQHTLLRDALVDHDRGLVSDDVTIGACWDSDRLTLPRLGITIDPELLSTAHARDVARTPDNIPGAAACTWEWAYSRIYLLDVADQPDVWQQLADCFDTSRRAIADGEQAA